jgi:hypothetical protein
MISTTTTIADHRNLPRPICSITSKFLGDLHG